MARNILKELMVWMIIFFMLLFGFELIKEGFVSNHFDLNILLVSILITGLVLLIISLVRSGEKKR